MMNWITAVLADLRQPLLILALLVAMAVLLAKPALRYVIDRVTDAIADRLLSDNYDQNLAELLPSLKRFSIINFIELSLRAQTGKVIARPLGSPKHFLGYDNLMFSPRQLTGLPLPLPTGVDMSVTLGVKAQRPLMIKIPLMIAGMAFGVGLSEEAKLALAKASNILQTANCSGEGPFLAAEARESGKYVLQVCCWAWGDRTAEQVAAVDMLELKMGQGSDIGPAMITPEDIAGKAQVLSGLAPGEPAVGLPAPPGVLTPQDWPEFMRQLRQKANGIPIALKIMATDHLEEELALAEKLGFDVVVIDGCEGGSHAAPPIKQDDFGMPSLYALMRARRFLQNSSMSLVVAGGYFTPGQCLKALALGADAVYLGTVPLFALGHNQTAKVLPWEPPTTLLYYNSPTSSQLDVDQAAASVVNVLSSMVDEMKEAMRALGKASLKELGPDDLLALDAVTAELTGVRLAFYPPLSKPEKGNCRQSLGELRQTLRYARLLAQFLEMTAKALKHKDSGAGKLSTRQKR